MPVPRLLAAVTAAAAALVVPVLVVPGAPASARVTDTDAAAPTGTVVYTVRFVGSDDAYHYQLWRRAADGSGTPIQLTADPQLLPYTGALSPDGRLVATTYGIGATADPRRLDVRAIDGSGVRNLLAGQSVVKEARDPDWSPDGKRLVFVGRDADSDLDLWVVGADGTGLRRLTTGGLAYTNRPQWSPDGTRVLWSPGTYDLASLDVATGVSTLVYDNRPSGRMNVDQYAWSPDGQTIAMSAATWDDVTTNLYLLPSDGSGSPTLLAEADQVSLSDPEFSPDGAWVGATARDASSEDGGSDVWLVDAAQGLKREPVVLDSGLVDAITDWGPTCATGCAPGGKASSISLFVHQGPRGNELTGGLMPGRYGTTVTLTLSRRDGHGRWKPVRSVKAVTSGLSTYDTALRRVSGGLCRISVAWPGDAKAAPASRTSSTFGC